MKEIRELTPAQDFQDGIAYCCIPVQKITEKGILESPEIITSEREHFPLSEEALLLKGFYIKRRANPLPRWSEKGIKSFLSGNPSPDIKEVFEGIRREYKTYLDLIDERFYSLLSIWALGTYFYRLFSVYPYIHLNGEIQSGKTKTLILTSLLSFNGELTFNSTPAYITRVIHNNHSTCCVDEAENLNSRNEGRKLLVSMYNAGYKKGVFTGKMEKEKGIWKPKLFEAYSPKIFASINGLSPALSSRSIPIPMVETSNKEIKNREIDINNPIFQEIRDNLYPLMLTQFKEIKETYHNLTDTEILGREWELWRPILALSKLIYKDEEKFYNEIRDLALKIISEKKEIRKEEIVPTFLISLKEMIEEYPAKDNFYPSSQIINFLKERDGVFGSINGKFLSLHLKKLALVDGNSFCKKIAGRVIRGYRLNPETISERLKAIGIR